MASLFGFHRRNTAPPSANTAAAATAAVAAANSKKENTDRISLTRSDGIHHDLLSVMNSPGYSEMINSSKSNSSSQKIKKEEDHNNISITRSDGLTHDIIQVFKGVTDARGETMRVTVKGRAQSAARLEIPQNIVTINPNTTFMKSVRIAHMSDTHNLLLSTMKKDFLPHGNILVHSGNFTANGTAQEFVQFNEWLKSVADLYHYRLVVLGHRDVKVFGNDWDAMKKLLPNATHVICHDEVTVLGIRFYGAPWHWGHRANYSVRAGAPASTTGRFDDIPFGVHVLITHGPAYDRLDVTYSGDSKDHWGSRELAEALRKCRPGLHLHGHIKDSRGIYPAFGNTPLAVNSCMVDKEATTLYATAHVIKATFLMADNNTNTASWKFAIDTLEG